MIKQLINGKWVTWGENYKFIIKVGNYYVKHTVNFGCYHGQVVLTDNIKEAKLYTRKKDAIYKSSIVKYRYNSYAHVRKSFKKIYQLDRLPKSEVIIYEI